MKYFLLIPLAVFFIACNDNSTTVIQHEMIVNPKALTYAHGVNTQNLSITHTCTCPFSWNVKVLDSTLVLKDTSGINDIAQVPITIDRTKLTADTLHTRLQITSNGYGTDTVAVTVLK